MKPIEHDPPSFQSTPLKGNNFPATAAETTSNTAPLQNGHDASASPVLSKLSKKGAAPPPPPKPTKLVSVKVRHAPMLTETHCYNGADYQPSSPTQQASAIHT